MSTETTTSLKKSSGIRTTNSLHGITGQDEDIFKRRYLQQDHIQIGCRTRLDHSRRHLNSRKPLSLSKKMTKDPMRKINRSTEPPGIFGKPYPTINYCSTKQHIPEVEANYNKDIPYRNTSLIIHSTILSPEYKDIDIELTLRPYHYKGIEMFQLPCPT